MEIYGDCIVYTSSILECIDATEYAALSDAAKDGVRILLSCGTVNMKAGSRCREILNQIFPSGITHDAIVAKWQVS